MSSIHSQIYKIKEKHPLAMEIERYFKILKMYQGLENIHLNKWITKVFTKELELEKAEMYKLFYNKGSYFWLLYTFK